MGPHVRSRRAILFRRRAMNTGAYHTLGPERLRLPAMSRYNRPLHLA